MNKRRTVILPVNSYLSPNKKITHMQIMKNDRIKKFEFRFFNKNKVIKKLVLKEMMIQVIKDGEKYLLNINENKKKNEVTIGFNKNVTIETSKKIVESIII